MLSECVRGVKTILFGKLQPSEVTVNDFGPVETTERV
jgi:hypothetical protein